MPVVQALLEALIREKPADPLNYIGIFMDRFSPSAEGTIPKESREPAKQTSSTDDPECERPEVPAEVEEAVPGFDGASAGVLVKRSADIEECRQQAKICLLSAAGDGRLEAALDESRQQAKFALISAAQDGRLEAALRKHDIFKIPECAAGVTVEESSTDQPLPPEMLSCASLATRTMPGDAMMCTAKDCMSEAASVCDMFLKAETPCPEEQAKSLAAQNELDCLANMARDVLAKGVESGSLKQSLAAAKLATPKPATPKPVTLEPSTPAPEATSVNEITILKTKALNSLVDACNTGNLDDLLRDINARRVQEQARNLLETSANDGRLTSALTRTQMPPKWPEETAAIAKMDDVSVEPAIAPMRCIVQPGVEARSLRHAELLGKQQWLENTNKQCEDRITRLKERKPASKTKRSVKRVTPVHQELWNANRTLSAENARLNAELARLLARASQVCA